MNKEQNKPMKIGLNVFGNRITEGDKATAAVTDDGRLIDFAVCHFEGRSYTLNESLETVRVLSRFFEERGVHFILNCEYQNFNEYDTASDGCEWADKSDGCHKLRLPDELMSVLSESKCFDGVMYDEFEHMIINRNPTIQIATKLRKIIPAFPLLKTNDGFEQGEYLKKQLKEYVDSFISKGSPAFFGEHVYPVMFHTFAESGITPNYKSLKENISNIAFAMAAGAALEYKLPLYNCIDNWFALTNPGHSAEEMYYNLLFAQKAGVDCAYSESVLVMADDEGNLTEHGRKFRQFCEEYKDAERNYSISDYRPEIGIVHYDDSYWGQWYPVLFKKTLFGNPKIKPDFRSKEIFKIFNIITHGETCKNGFSWGRFSLWSLRKHFSFVSMNSTAVFDHRAGWECFDSLKLCFLCGIHISDETLKYAAKAVKENGMTVVTPKRFVPREILSQAKGSISEIRDGKGKWIVVKNYKVSNLKKYVKEFLGTKGEMRLTFSNEEVVMKIKNGGNTFDIVS